MDEEENEDMLKTGSTQEKYCTCTCTYIESESSEKIELSARKSRILSTVTRTENYLRERRIPEIIRFLLTKVIANGSDKPIAYLEKLLNDCMLFRAGHGLAPALYETRHLEAVIKSFDPGQRGWLSAGQMRRAFITLGFTPNTRNDDRISTVDALASLEKAQERDLFNLLAAGSSYAVRDNISASSSNSSIVINMK